MNMTTTRNHSSLQHFQDAKDKEMKRTLRRGGKSKANTEVTLIICKINNTSDGDTFLLMK